MLFYHKNREVMTTRHFYNMWLKHTRTSHIENPPTCNSQGTLWTKGQKDCKSQRITEFVVRLCLLKKLDTTPIKSY